MKHKLNEIFEKIYVINVDSNTNRMENIKKELCGVDYERFSAVTPQSVEFIKNEECYVTDIELSITLSHIKVLKKARELNLRNVLIFEDDIVADKDFLNFKYEYIDNFLSTNDWAFFYLGGFHIKVPNSLQLGILNNISILASHAYAINRKYYDIIIDHLEKAKFKIPVDVDCAYYLHSVLPSFAVYPRLYLQSSREEKWIYKDVSINGGDSLQMQIPPVTFAHYQWGKFIPQELFLYLFVALE